ncbi:hypothetical protein I4U23_010250 [Adineta vaga]|nr:hypothetical protein I4U23_010250 [Adineta vaga]
MFTSCLCSRRFLHGNLFAINSCFKYWCFKEDSAMTSIINKLLGKEQENNSRYPEDVIVRSVAIDGSPIWDFKRDKPDNNAVESSADHCNATTHSEKVNSTVSEKPTRKCTDCKKPSQLKCLHCSNSICLVCAQKHVALSDGQIDAAQNMLNEKMSIIHRLAAAAKQRVNADCDQIALQIDIEREQAFAQIDQIAEEKRKEIRNRSARLAELSSDEISSYVQSITSKMNYINDTDYQLLHIESTPPKIQVKKN